MPVPNSISELSVAAASNSPKGTENVGPNANAYIQAAFAFIAQIASGAGFKPTSAMNMNSQKLTNVGAGSATRSSTDTLNASQIVGLCHKVGEVRMWHGAVANIASVWGAGWQLANGTNGTADLRDRFIVGAGNTLVPNQAGGSASLTLSVDNLPAHSHGVLDNGHAHGVNDPGHAHSTTLSNSGTSSGPDETLHVSRGSPQAIGTNGAVTNISIRAAATGISIQNTGAGRAIDPRPPYYALCFVEYTGIGA